MQIDVHFTSFSQYDPNQPIFCWQNRVANVSAWNISSLLELDPCQIKGIYILTQNCKQLLAPFTHVKYLNKMRESYYTFINEHGVAVITLIEKPACFPLFFKKNLKYEHNSNVIILTSNGKASFL